MLCFALLALLDLLAMLASFALLALLACFAHRQLAVVQWAVLLICCLWLRELCFGMVLAKHAVGAAHRQLAVVPRWFHTLL